MSAGSDFQNGRPSNDSVWARLKFFLTPIDVRYEEVTRQNWYLIGVRDFSAGLIVAMMAIPMAMGFAMASGLRPEQGIVGGAVAGLVGALFGGSKYQVYGPTAALIPVVGGLMAAYTANYEQAGLSPEAAFTSAHGFLVLVSIISGVILISLGLGGLGKLANLVPHSIVVGFTIGIAATIALSQIGEVLGLKVRLGTEFVEKIRGIAEHAGEFNGYSVLVAVLTFLITRYMLKISIYIPAPLIAIGIGSVLSATLLSGKDLTLIGTKYGEIPTQFLVFTLPVMPELTPSVIGDIAYFVAAIVFVAGVESLLCSRMADRLADNRGTPFNANKEFWGQGLVQIFTPLVNGFPHTGALARTATNIKVGAVTPAAGIWKGVLKILLAFFLAKYLQLVPMACIGGLLMWVAFNMVKPAEIKQVLAHNKFHVCLMIYTAVAVILTDFLTGVLTAMLIYGVLFKFCDKPASMHEQELDVSQSDRHSVGSACAPLNAGSAV